MYHLPFEPMAVGYYTWLNDRGANAPVISLAELSFSALPFGLHLLA